MKNNKIDLITAVLLNNVRKISDVPSSLSEKYGVNGVLARGQISEASRDDSLIKKIADISEKITERSNRKSETAEKSGFSENRLLESFFDNLNIENQKDIQYFYSAEELSEKPNMPAEKGSANTVSLNNTAEKISGGISKDISSLNDINTLISAIEKYTSYIPSGNGSDISFFDSAKLTAAAASCIYDAISENPDIENMLDKPEALYEQKIFMLFSFDTSGIQDFIYTIASSGALKGLRARSFYLEIMMECIIDELLTRLELSRANLIYSGGGHAYMLLPDTEKTSSVISDLMDGLQDWLKETFKTSLYIASGSCGFSANSMANIPDGSYKNIFRTVSEKISQKKLCRYGAADLEKWNRPHKAHERECSICHRTDMLCSDNKCTICSSLEKLGSYMFKSDFFIILDRKVSDSDIVMPFGKYMTADPKYINDSSVVRIFEKNVTEHTAGNAVKIYLGDYASEKEFKKLVKKSSGIERLGVLRADVDNLGHAFVSGFPDSLTTLSRTSAFSRSLSLFFKYHINYILKNGKFYIGDIPETKERNAVIIYAGGDDVFIAGSWDDIIGTAVDMHNSLKKFTLNRLKISAGIGIFNEKYPISAMARETGELEENSKNMDGKDSITLFSSENCYKWDTLIDNVFGEKYTLISEYFKNNEDHGNALLYNMLSLIRDKENDKLNIARFAYLLAKLKPEGKKKTPEKIELYKKFSENLYNWIQNPDDCRCLVTAIQIYIYYHRDKKEDNNV